MLIAAILTAASLASAGLGQKSPTSGLEIRTIRFWAPTAKVTYVLSLVDIPYSLASPIGEGTAAFIAYDVTVKVLGNNDAQLLSETWSRHAAAGLRAQGATGMEQVEFPVKPGTYTLQVTVKDSATGRTVVDSAKVDAFESAPEASDLILASDMRAVAPTDTTTQPGEIARGVFRFVSAPVPQIDVTKPDIAYMLEAYSADSTTGQLQLTLLTMAGAVILQVPEQDGPIAAGGGVFSGKIPLEGLPAGQYRLKAALTVKGTTTAREAVFSMAEPKAALARSVALTASSRGIDAVFFAAQPEDSLDAMADELSLLDVPKRQLAVYKKDELPLESKRRFLIDFWAQRDKNKNTPVNEDRVAFYAAVDYANANFSQRNVPGWKTDRGRIYTKFGLPDDSLPSTMNSAVPYLVWRYTHGKSRWFIFDDRTNGGNWQLVQSNEPTVVGMPGSLVEQLGGPNGDGTAAAQTIGEWLGLGKMYFVNQ